VSRSRSRYVLWNFITVLHEASPTAGILALRSASTPLVMVLTEVHVPPTPILISAVSTFGVCGPRLTFDIASTRPFRRSRSGDGNEGPDRKAATPKPRVPNQKSCVGIPIPRKNSPLPEGGNRPPSPVRASRRQAMRAHVYGNNFFDDTCALAR